MAAHPQVLDWLQRGKMDILVAGDSMMRQLYIRLVHMMRGSRRVLDYHIHTHANYAVRAAVQAGCVGYLAGQLQPS